MLFLIVTRSLASIVCSLNTEAFLFNELDDFSLRRQKVALVYDEELSDIDGIIVPHKEKYSNHVYHQYTLKIKKSKRDQLKSYLSDYNIPSMIYYPIPLYKQNAFSSFYDGSGLTNTEVLCNQVLSLPIHTEMKSETQNFIINKLKDFFRNE